MTKTKYVILVIAILCILAGCTDDNETNRSTLKLCLREGNASRTILPDSQSLDIDHYTITGNGPEGSSFSRNCSETSVTLSGLLIGEWTLSVTGYNDKGVRIASGSTTIQLKRAPLSTTIYLNATPGTGTIDIEMRWDPALAYMPNLDLKMKDPEGNITSPVPTHRDYENGYARYLGTTHPAGSYQLIGNLYCNDIKVAGYAETIRVIDGISSHAVIDLTLDKISDLPLTVDLINNVGKPVVCKISGISKEMATDRPVTAKLTVYDTNSEMNVTWYLNGMEIAKGLECTFTPTPGPHRLDVIAESDTQIGATGSASFPFVGKGRGTPGIPTYLNTFTGDKSFKVSAAGEVAILPDNNLLIASPRDKTIQICKMIRGTPVPIRTYDSHANFVTEQISDILVDPETSCVYIANNLDRTIAKLQYSAIDGSLTLLFTSDDWRWKSGDPDRDQKYRDIGRLSMDLDRRHLYVTDKDNKHALYTLYDMDATCRDDFYLSASCFLGFIPKYGAEDPFGDRRQVSYCSEFFIAEDGSRGAALFPLEDLFFYMGYRMRTPQDVLASFRGKVYGNWSTGIEDIRNLTTICFLDNPIALIGTDDRIVSITDNFDRDAHSTEYGYDFEITHVYRNQQFSIDGRTCNIRGVSQILWSRDRKFVYVLCTGSRNLITFRYLGRGQLQGESVHEFNDFIPCRMELSQDNSMMTVTSEDRAQIRIFTIPDRHL